MIEIRKSSIKVREIHVIISIYELKEKYCKKDDRYGVQSECGVTSVVSTIRESIWLVFLVLDNGKTG